MNEYLTRRKKRKFQKLIFEIKNKKLIFKS